ncbi:MAG: alpha/beta hydrolase [Variibacter sp.]|nr:alpha/beta hydrolase [Variibacter sp.]
MSIVKAGSWSLNVVEQGSGPTLLLIHGLAGDHTAWAPHLAAFSRDYRVVAFDNPGSGKSSAVTAPTSMRELAESVLRLMDALKIESAHVVGRSMGGAMAQQLAVMAPERVRSLVLAASFAKLDPLGKRLLENMREVVQWRRSWTEWTRLFSHTFVSHAFFNQNQERMAQIEKLVGDESRDRTSYENLCTAVIETSQLDILGAIRCPTLIMAGRQDGICSPVATGWMKERMPAAELVFFENSSHFFLMEEAEKAMATLADWFKRHG